MTSISMCPRESIPTQPGPMLDQQITKNPDMYVCKRSALRDEMMAMENKRREEAQESQKTLLKEIKKFGCVFRVFF